MNKLSKTNYYRVLVFSPLKRLIGIFQSVTAAANAFNTSATNIHYACNGKSISCCNLYFRHFYEDKIDIDVFEDLGKLKLEEYDRLAGLTRKYYDNKDMTRKGMKHKK